MSNRSQLAGNCSWMLFFFIGIVLSSCTPTTGTRVPLSQDSLSKVKRISISVKTEEDFSVRLSREKMTGTGAVLFGLLGAGIESGARLNADQKREEGFKPIIGQFDPKKLMEERLRHYMQLAKTFIIIDEDPGVLKDKKLDGALEVTLKEWGLRLCGASGSSEQVQVGFGVHGKMSSLEDHSTVWERHELYLDGECHPLEDFRKREGLLESALTRTIDNLSGKIVNEICFP
jgi:hypothetical protein